MMHSPKNIHNLFSGEYPLSSFDVKHINPTFVTTLAVDMTPTKESQAPIPSATNGIGRRKVVSLNASTCASNTWQFYASGQAKQ